MGWHSSLEAKREMKTGISDQSCESRPVLICKQVDRVLILMLYTIYIYYTILLYSLIIKMSGEIVDLWGVISRVYTNTHVG